VVVEPKGRVGAIVTSRKGKAVVQIRADRVRPSVDADADAHKKSAAGKGKSKAR
jgi:hypothetical protein